jgi:hypothetical protein
MAVFCRYHCSTCDRHFTSLNAFDGHRTGPSTARVCVEPDARFESEPGICRVRTPDTRGAIWWLVEDRKRMVAAFQQRRPQERPTGRQSASLAA